MYLHAKTTSTVPPSGTAFASLRCLYWKYVHDITISEFAAARGVSILQSELDNISTWAATNNMVLNPQKYKEDDFAFS